MYTKKELYIFECACLPQYFSEISNVYLFKSCVCRFRYKNISFHFTTPLIVRSVNRSTRHNLHSNGRRAFDDDSKRNPVISRDQAPL